MGAKRARRQPGDALEEPAEPTLPFFFSREDFSRVARRVARRIRRNRARAKVMARRKSAYDRKDETETLDASVSPPADTARPPAPTPVLVAPPPASARAVTKAGAHDDEEDDSPAGRTSDDRDDEPDDTPRLAAAGSDPTR